MNVPEEEHSRLVLAVQETKRNNHFACLEQNDLGQKRLGPQKRCHFPEL